ncbi:MAG: glycerate kinase [Armatimonadetes bacterium JP3_11]|nr:MAG: glycerate kinase [Armatimonadetes bacterium JP3_11]RMH07037.1 MAG: glycerate kinase [Armatimonadota bacterium]
MRLLIAPTAYKGTLSPVEATEVIAEAVCPHTQLHSHSASEERLENNNPCDLCPIADGGTGWLEVWAFHFPQAQRVAALVQDALGRPRTAEWLLLPNGVAVLESAQAIGIHWLPATELEPMAASSYGVGQMLQQAATHPDTRELWLGLGGVATTDGGAGALQALGFRLLDAQGNSIPQGGAGLRNLHRVELPDAPPLHGKPLVLCADVQNTLLDAARVYAPQKGASPQQVKQLIQGLEQLAAVVQRETGIDLHTNTGSGAAGGLAGGLHAYLGAPIVSGIAWLLKQIHGDTRLSNADCLITGEGQVDAQTLMGKGVGILIQHAVALGKPVIVLAGRKGEGWETVARLPRVQVFACAEVAPHLPPTDALRETATTAFKQVHYNTDADHPAEPYLPDGLP